MPIVLCENKTYQNACNTSEMQRQVADTTALQTFNAAGAGPAAQPAYDAALKANVIADLRRRLASATANGMIEPMASNSAALRELGTGGV